jgi:NitT/TauT family transport system permease protein
VNGARALRLAVGLGGLVLGWQALVWTSWVPREYLPGVPEIGRAALELAASRRFWTAEGDTVMRSGVGLLVSSALGIALALAGARVRLIDRGIQPMVDILRSLPPSALVPLAIFAMGLGTPLYLFIIVFGGVWPVYVCAQNALAAASPVQRHTAAAFGYSRSETLWRVQLPAALPEIFAGVRIAAGACLISTVAVEMLAGQSGIGFLLFDSAFSLRTPETFALLVAAGVNGVVFNQAVAALRSPLAGWQDELAATADAGA